MFELVVTKYIAEGYIEVTEYGDVTTYKTTKDYLILERKSSGSTVYIRKDQVLEFEAKLQVKK